MAMFHDSLLENDLQAALVEGPVTPAELMQYSIASRTSSMLLEMDELIALSRDFSNPDAQSAIEAEFQTIDALVTRGQLLLSFLESRKIPHGLRMIRGRK